MQATLRRLQREWHPDKNRGAEEDARRVFEFVQAQWERWRAQNGTGPTGSGPAGGPAGMAPYNHPNKKKPDFFYS